MPSFEQRWVLHTSRRSWKNALVRGLFLHLFMQLIFLASCCVPETMLDPWNNHFDKSYMGLWTGKEGRCETIPANSK